VPYRVRRWCCGGCTDPTASPHVQACACTPLSVATVLARTVTQPGWAVLADWCQPRPPRPLHQHPCGSAIVQPHSRAQYSSLWVPARVSHHHPRWAVPTDCHTAFQLPASLQELVVMRSLLTARGVSCFSGTEPVARPHWKGLSATRGRRKQASRRRVQRPSCLSHPHHRPS
jgi:hypothetical protein